MSERIYKIEVTDWTAETSEPMKDAALLAGGRIREDYGIARTRAGYRQVTALIPEATRGVFESYLCRADAVIDYYSRKDFPVTSHPAWPKRCECRECKFWSAQSA